MQEVINKINEYSELLKTIKFEKIQSDKHFIERETYNCYLNNGEVIVREKIIKNGTDGSAAIILPITENNEVILTIEPRVFSKTTIGIGIPAGYIENGESAKIAALRELQEEIGYYSDTLISLGGFYQDMGISSAYNELFLALNCRKVSDQNLDDGEYIKYLKCKYEEALKLIDEGYILSANAIIAFERSKKYVKQMKVR